MGMRQTAAVSLAAQYAAIGLEISALNAVTREQKTVGTCSFGTTATEKLYIWQVTVVVADP